jgi:hypothetical protein
MTRNSSGVVFEAPMAREKLAQPEAAVAAARTATRANGLDNVRLPQISRLGF